MVTRTFPNTVINPIWLNTPEGESILKQFYDPYTSTRKLFGILEKPCTELNYEEVSYKLFVIGKSSSGKTKLIADLAGYSMMHPDSHGIRKTNLYWPTKIWDKFILFRLQFWEASDSGLKKFSHILPACLDKMDALVCVFSFEDGNSFLEISLNILKFKGNELNQPAIIVIGTKYSAVKKMAVSLGQIKEFELKWKLNVLKLPEMNHCDIHRICPISNLICEKLWVRDQEYILKQSFDRFALKE